MDGDGLGTREVLAAATDENTPDTDGDSLPDAEEVRVHKTSPSDRDSDDDCIEDDVELSTGTDPRVADSVQFCPEG